MYFIYMFTPYFREDFQFDSYFSTGLKPPFPEFEWLDFGELFLSRISASSRFQPLVSGRLG